MHITSLNPETIIVPQVLTHLLSENSTFSLKFATSKSDPALFLGLPDSWKMKIKTRTVPTKLDFCLCSNESSQI